MRMTRQTKARIIDLFKLEHRKIRPEKLGVKEQDTGAIVVIFKDSRDQFKKMKR